MTVSKADLKVRLYVRVYVATLVVLIAMVVEAGLQARLAAQDLAPQQHGRLFPPQDLGLLEGPDRDAWQKPEQIMDTLAIADGSAVADIETRVGPIDVLVNNAGWDRFSPFLDSEPVLWDELIAINLRGPLNLHHHVGRRMAERKRGRIVNIASDAGRVGSSGEAVYSACKGGIIAFSKSLARELARLQINVNVVCPGPTNTPILQSFLGEGEEGQRVYEGLKRAIPFRRIAEPDDIQGMVVFLASDDAAYLTGQVISVSGGLTMHG